MKKSHRIILVLLIHPLLSVSQDGNTFDTLKASIFKKYAGICCCTDTAVKRIETKLEEAKSYLEIFSTRLVDAKDTVYYHKKRQALNELKKQERIQVSKTLAKVKEKLLLELSILAPDASCPYYAEWLQILFPELRLDPSDLGGSTDFCFYRAFLYTLLIKQFPGERWCVFNLGATYYNQGVVIIKGVDAEDKDLMEKMNTAKLFMEKGEHYLKAASKMR